MILDYFLLVIGLIYQYSTELGDRRYAFASEPCWKRLCFSHIPIKHVDIYSTQTVQHTISIIFQSISLINHIQRYSSFSPISWFTHTWQYRLYKTYGSLMDQLNMYQLNIIYTIHRSFSNQIIIHLCWVTDCILGCFNQNIQRNHDCKSWLYQIINKSYTSSFVMKGPRFDPWHVLYTYLVPRKHTERPLLRIFMVSNHLWVIHWQFGDEMTFFDLQIRNFDRTLKIFHNMFQIGVRWLM